MSKLGGDNLSHLKPISAHGDDYFALFGEGKPSPERRWRRRGAAEVERRESTAAGRRIVLTCEGDGKHALVEVGHADERLFGEGESIVRWELHPHRDTGGTLAQISDDGLVRSAADLKRRRSTEEAYIADGQGTAAYWGAEAITASFRCSECDLNVRRREGGALDKLLSELPTRLGKGAAKGDLKVWTISVRALVRMEG